jgi:hypothetical protein
MSLATGILALPAMPPDLRDATLGLRIVEGILRTVLAFSQAGIRPAEPVRLQAPVPP